MNDIEHGDSSRLDCPGSTSPDEGWRAAFALDIFIHLLVQMGFTCTAQAHAVRTGDYFPKYSTHSPYGDILNI